MTIRNSLFIRRATLGLLLLAHMFLQVQVAIACAVGNLPGLPCSSGAAATIEHVQNGSTVSTDCCETAYQPASALYDAATPPSKDAPSLAGHAPQPTLVAFVDIIAPITPTGITVANHAFPPGVVGTDLYLTTLRLRI